MMNPGQGAPAHRTQGMFGARAQFPDCREVRDGQQTQRGPIVPTNKLVLFITISPPHAVPQQACQPGKQ